jgi:catechol 2,3-dioxygenase
MSSAASRAYGNPPPAYRLPDATRVGRVRLQVSDLRRSIAYYRDVLGFTIDEDGDTARLRTLESSDYLIELHYEPGTRPVPRAGVLGLYHFAILVPSRPALAQFVTHLTSLPLQFGAADHLVSEAIYLWDPDGLGIEVYADRPREQWQTNGRELVMTTEHLDVTGLMAAATTSQAWAGMPHRTTMGHMHLSVGDLDDAARFYHRALGFETVVWSYPGALFMSAGGYHHHLGTNTWAAGARKASRDDARLIEWEIVVPTMADVHDAEASLRAAGYIAHQGSAVDPWGTSLRLTAAM